MAYSPFDQQGAEQQAFSNNQGSNSHFQGQDYSCDPWDMAQTSNGHSSQAPWPMNAAGGYGGFARAAGASDGSLVDHSGASQGFDGSAGNPPRFAASSQPPYYPADLGPNTQIHDYPPATSSSSTANPRTDLQSSLPNVAHAGRRQSRLAPCPSTTHPRRSPRKKACPTCRGGSCAGHSQSELEPPVPVGLVGQQPPLGTSTLYKHSPEVFEWLKGLICALEWFQGDGFAEEPAVEGSDYFVTANLINESQKSRFFAFVHVDPVTGHYHCRIPHNVKKGGEHLDCIYRTLQSKDAIAHVRDCLGYKAYKCPGRDVHQACGQYFLTRERCNDHLSKKNKEREPMVQCDKCTAKPMLQRNLPRHLEMKHSEAQ